ncbi:integrase, catalytic region, zinc finger, CCHC-type containing protein [Tanacetum coccineum]
MMTTLAEYIIVAGAENRPPMLDKSMYDSWAIRVLLFIKGKKYGRMMLDSIHNSPLVYPTVKEDRQTRPKKYSELNEAQQLQDDCDVQATNILLHGLPPDVYALVKHQEATKDIWDKVKLLMKGEDPIECINKAMAFLSAIASRNRGIATTSKGNFVAGQPRVVKCYNCQGEGHIARQCTQPKRPRNAAWFKEKLLLAEAKEAGQILDEEQLAFLADPGMDEVPVAQQTIPHNAAFQTEDLDAYDSDCDDISSAKAILMANLSSCDSDVLFKVSYSDAYSNDMNNQDVQEMQYSEQTHIDDFQDNEIHSDSNIITYSQYMQETQDAGIQDTNSSAPNDLLVLSLVEQMADHVAHLDKENQTNKTVNESLSVELERYKERVVIFEQRQNVDLNKREKLIDSQMDDLIRNRNAKLAACEQEIATLKETLSNHVKEKESLSKTLTVFKT